MRARSLILCAGFALAFATLAARANDDGLSATQPWRGEETDFLPLMRDIGTAHTVLIGEETHGTHEFLVERARISAALIDRLGFEAVLVEAPWASLLAVDDYVAARPGAPDSARAALAKTRGFPRWVVQNPPFAAFLEQLRGRSRPPRVLGFDLYSLPESAQALIDGWRRLGKEEAAQRAERDLSCFFRDLEEPMRYGLAVETLAAEPCGAGAVRQRALWAIAMAGREDEEAFRLRLHAETVVAAEGYYRAIYRAGESSWNRRERHLFAVIETIRTHLRTQGGQGKLIVWAHNTHVGDARATDQGHVGELSLGQLMRERHGTRDVFLLGMTTRKGTVRAADGWGLPDRIKRLRSAPPDSIGARLGSVGMPAFYLSLRRESRLSTAFAASLPERAIGVVYTPRRERRDHHFSVRLADQFDALLHLDETHALATLR